jgi:hypothetical protein
MHSYNDDGGAIWTEPPLLNQTLREANCVMQWTRDYSPPDTNLAPVWCGECGSHSHGGITATRTAFSHRSGSCLLGEISLLSVCPKSVSGPVAIYELSATPLHNGTVMLNGDPLVLRGDTFPVSEPIWVGTWDASGVGELVLSPTALAFLVWPFARYEPCVY